MEELKNVFEKIEEPTINIKEEIESIITIPQKIIDMPNLKKVKHLDLLLRHFIYLTYSAYVKEELSLSGLIYAWQERGKSTVVLSVKHTGFLIEDDITAYGLARKLNDLYEKNQMSSIHHLIIPDLEKISSRTRTVKNELRSFLQTLMWDGVQNIDTYNIHLNFTYRLRLPIIACVTPDVFNAKSAFRRLGFLSRLIPFSFNYNTDTVNEILKFIGTIEEDKLRLETTKILSKKKMIIIVPERYFPLLESRSRTLADIVDHFCPYKYEDEQRLIGSRAKNMLTCYLKAIALANDHTAVKEADWLEFETMFEYFNFDMKKLP